MVVELAHRFLDIIGFGITYDLIMKIEKIKNITIMKKVLQFVIAIPKDSITIYVLNVYR